MHREGFGREVLDRWKGEVLSLLQKLVLLGGDDRLHGGHLGDAGEDAGGLEEHQVAWQAKELSGRLRVHPGHRCGPPSHLLVQPESVKIPDELEHQCEQQREASEEALVE